MTHRFRRSSSGIEVTLEPTEYAVLERVPALLGSIGADRDDPASARLDPPVHPGNDKASSEFVRLAGVEVTHGRSVDAEMFGHSVAAGQAGRSLSLEAAEAWVRALGTARIALIARSGRDFDDASFTAADRTDPNLLLVDYLGVLQEELLTVLMADVPPDGDG